MLEEGSEAEAEADDEGEADVEGAEVSSVLELELNGGSLLPELVPVPLSNTNDAMAGPGKTYVKPGS